MGYDKIGLKKNDWTIEKEMPKIEKKLQIIEKKLRKIE